MKICLNKINNMCTCNEFNLVICADGGIGKQIRRNLPKCICGDGIKINIIVTGCDGVLEAPALPCNNLFTISSPIKVIRKNPCCKNEPKHCCDEFGMDGFIDSCNVDKDFCTEKFGPQEFAIIVRSFSPAISEFLCEFPQIFITDCDKTTKLIIIFDKNGSVFEPQCSNNCGGGCGCGGGCDFGDGGACGGGCGCGGGGGFGGLFGIAALALLFCC